eukprot:670086-Hanusia_phi.AAC.1
MAGSEWSWGSINGHLIILPAPVSSSGNVGQTVTLMYARRQNTDRSEITLLYSTVTLLANQGQVIRGQ